jgi:hypothetical protein
MANFENDTGLLLQVFHALSHPSHEPIFSHVAFQNLFHITASIMEEHAVSFDGVDLLVDCQSCACSDELLVQMKEWCSYLLFELLFDKLPSFVDGSRVFCLVH